MKRQRFNVIDMYNFYIEQGHWLYMSKKRMIEILADLYKTDNKTFAAKIHKAMQLIENISNERKQYMRLEHVKNNKTNE